MIVIVHGPQASGKTRHADALLLLFDCRRIVDDWDVRTRLRDGDLALTNERQPYAWLAVSGLPTRTIAIDLALTLLGLDPGYGIGSKT